MDSRLLADKAIAEAMAATWASEKVKIQIAFGRCAEHIYWCEDQTLIPKAGLTVQTALEYVMMHFNHQNEPTKV